MVGKGYVSQASWPEADESLVSPKIEKSEELVQNIIKDINQIKKMVKGDVEKNPCLPCSDWKWDLYEIAEEIGKPDIGQIMGRAIGANIYDDKKK